jgi:hypothetical protein
MDPDPAKDPDPTPDPIRSSVTLSMEKNIKNFIFFLITYPQAQYLQSLKPNADQRLKKAKNKCFLEFNMATINGLGGSIL